MLRSGWAIVILATGAAGMASRGLRLRLHTPQAPNSSFFIPKTVVPMPVDYEDYTRGRTPWALFDGIAPGSRHPEGAAGPGLPTFNPASAEEFFIEALPTDRVGHDCAPGGDAAAHYFYNVMKPELVPYILAKNDPKNTGTAVVIAPGGGNIHLAWEPEGISWAEWFNTIGVSAFVLKYRIPNGGGIQLMDAQRAMSLVRSKADQYGINPKRIGFVGSSAGGALALALQRAKERAYDPKDAIDYVASKPDFLLLQYPGIDTALDATPENVRSFPPTAFGFAEDDPCCRSGPAHVLKSALENYATSPLLIRAYTEGGHGWGSCDYYPQLRGMDVCTWKDSVKTWLMESDLL